MRELVIVCVSIAEEVDERLCAADLVSEIVLVPLRVDEIVLVEVPDFVDVREEEMVPVLV